MKILKLLANLPEGPDVERYDRSMSGAQIEFDRHWRSLRCGDVSYEGAMMDFGERTVLWGREESSGTLPISLSFLIMQAFNGMYEVVEI
ncbi:hypothetical protein V6N11_084181 [Hibiscus sabdariffa]|uniref:Uncharacterized protein n=1 Tax=Hibiscus sabdariffa TaxID=183260 RepID=A0ABR2QSA0_9ROSI